MLSPSLTEATLECFRRASGSDALPARNLELGYAMKGALVLSALAKAYDSHRDAIFKAQRDEASWSYTKHRANAGESSLWSEDPLRRTMSSSRRRG